MNKQKLTNEYQIYLMVSPCNLPFFFLKHHWLVVNNRGVITRWETGYSRTIGVKRWGYLRTNAFPHYDGIPILPMSHKWLWRGKIEKTFSGAEGSLAHELVCLVEKSPEAYPYKENYGWFGPNSNTYPQWILNQFLEINHKLPCGSIGKNYK